ncbi:MAG: bifunctional precorrin-2 dehydrogenase/sirohydrochlorin ferrochelatase [Synergistaceae bacterium]|jgi:precorrin-2 dehydrogenase/sirohydrochlorin ferrochelatase/precorrin-6A/cobalt-precorrin-6A reductase|nr:bifunctional precorrin-2 dehydrogenase/sirohydrochlorin ferrochelatase [Synergistaceae bacterium]
MEGKFPLFPLFTDISGCRVLVVGGGSVALRRAGTLLTCGARVTVVSPEFHEGFQELHESEAFSSAPGTENPRLIRRPFENFDLEGFFMVVLATDDRELNRRVGQRAKKAGLHVSVADAREECSFFFPALVAEKDAVAAVSGGGRPDLTRRLADRLRQVWSAWVAEETDRDQNDEEVLSQREKDHPCRQP